MQEGERMETHADKALSSPAQGGFRAAMFIFASAGMENIGVITSMVSMVHFDLSGGATTLTNFVGSTFLLTLVGGFISDTYLNRLNTVLLFGLVEILGYILLILQAHYDQLRPPSTCITCQLNGGNAWMFYISLCLLALGWGGVRGAMPSLGADQFDRNHPLERKQMSSFFNWLLMSITMGATLGVTFIVWINMNRGWSLGFLICMMLALVGFALVTMGKPYYRVRVAGDSPLIRVVQVIVLSIRNHNLPMPQNQDELYEIKEKGDVFVEERLPHTNQLRWLDKAAILSEGTSPEKWKVCSVTQVEETKVLVQMLPIIASTIVMNTCLAQLQTFSIEQGNMMDLHLGSFKFPAASIPVIPLVFMSLLIPVYEFAFIPLMPRFTGHPNGITQLQRVGIGLVLSIISMAIAAIVEVKRKNAFNLHFKQISLFWLSFQFGIFGVADLFTLVGLMEFFYSEAPDRMRSLATSFSWLSLSLGYFLSSIFVNIVNAVTKKLTPSRQGWLEGQTLNDSNLHLFYWFLAIMSCINFAVYLLCAKWYKYRKEVHEDGQDGIPSSPKVLVGHSSDLQDDEAAKKGAMEVSMVAEKLISDEGPVNVDEKN